VTFGL